MGKKIKTGLKAIDDILKEGIPAGKMVMIGAEDPHIIDWIKKSNLESGNIIIGADFATGDSCTGFFTPEYKDHRLYMNELLAVPIAYDSRGFDALLAYELAMREKYDNVGSHSRSPKMGDRMEDFAIRWDTTKEEMKLNWGRVEEELKAYPEITRKINFISAKGI